MCQGRRLAITTVPLLLSTDPEAEAADSEPSGDEGGVASAAFSTGRSERVDVKPYQSTRPGRACFGTRPRSSPAAIIAEANQKCDGNVASRRTNQRSSDQMIA